MNTIAQFGAAPTITSPLPADFAGDAMGVINQTAPLLGGVLIVIVAFNVIKFVFRKASKLGK